MFVPKIWKANLTWNCPSVKVLLGNPQEVPVSRCPMLTWKTNMELSLSKGSYLQVSLTIWGTTSLTLHKYHHNKDFQVGTWNKKDHDFSNSISGSRDALHLPFQLFTDQKAPHPEFAAVFFPSCYCTSVVALFGCGAGIYIYVYIYK